MGPTADLRLGFDEDEKTQRKWQSAKQATCLAGQVAPKLAWNHKRRFLPDFRVNQFTSCCDPYAWPSGWEGAVCRREDLHSWTKFGCALAQIRIALYQIRMCSGPGFETVSVRRESTRATPAVFGSRSVAERWCKASIHKQSGRKAKNWIGAKGKELNRGEKRGIDFLSGRERQRETDLWPFF